MDWQSKMEQFKKQWDERTSWGAIRRGYCSQVGESAMDNDIEK